MAGERHYYFNPKILDLSKVRESAVALSRGNKRNAPVIVTIHWHFKYETCIGHNHEIYENGTMREY